MYILNIEDDIFKHHNICKALENGRFSNLQIDCRGNLEDGINAIKEHNAAGTPYDLIITDMWYPEYAGGAETESGEKLIGQVRENGWTIPVILCSSVDYSIPEILGTVHYSEREDWENDLLRLVKSLG